MTKLAAIVLILALPALVAADINRVRLGPGPEQPDALRWNMRMQRPELTVVPSVQPAWASICTPNPTERSSYRVPCPCPAAQHLGLCLSQPDCLNHANAPILWPHAPRADEQKTAAKEPRPEQAQVQYKHSAN